MSELNFSFNDQDGGVELSRRGQITVVSLAGACGDDVIDFFVEKLQVIAKTYDGNPWAYLCNSKDFQATTPEGQKKIIQNYRYCIQAGCRCDAYCYDSPVGIAQTEAIMRACGNTRPIAEVLFDSEQQAFDYLHHKLQQHMRRMKQRENTSK